MEITEQPRRHQGPPGPPPLDLSARDRIEQVATSLLDLVGTLEVRLQALEARQMDLEDALSQLGMVQVPRG